MKTRKYKCLKTLRMIASPHEVAFVKGRVYPRIDGFAGIEWGFVDENKEKHEVSNSHWEKHFEEMPQQSDPGLFSSMDAKETTTVFSFSRSEFEKLPKRNKLTLLNTLIKFVTTELDLLQ
jgi:hypothetical protein